MPLYPFLDTRRASSAPGIPASHYDALFLLLAPVALFYFLVSRRPDLHGCPAAHSSSDRSQALFRTLVASIGSLDVPDIGFEDIPPAANAHLGKVAHGVLCLDIACISAVSDLYTPVYDVQKKKKKKKGNLPSSAERRAHSYASSSSFSRIGSAPTMYHAQRPIMAAAWPRSAAPV